jgi:preprotein translocase subunit SecE
MSFIQYLKDTRSELRHVAWPTQTQTIVFTVLVVALSIFVSLYLGLFDYIFTGIIQRYVDAGGFSTPAVTMDPVDIATSTVTSTTTNQ